MNAHLNLSLAAEPFHVQPQLSRELQQQLGETGQSSSNERSLAQLMNLDYKSNSVISGAIPSNNHMNNADLLKNTAQKDLSSFNANSLISAMAPGMRNDMLNRLLFPTPLPSTAQANSFNMGQLGRSAGADSIDLSQHSLSENAVAAAAAAVQQPTQDNNALFEPAPINESNMTVLQQGFNDASAFQLWRHQQQQQMQNLVNMVFQPSAASLQQQNFNTLMAASNTSNEAAKRSLNASASLMSSLDSDLFRGPAAKKHRTSEPSSSVVLVDEDCMNKSGRFRDYQSCQWSVRFHELQLFRRAKGHCCVPHGYPENPVLARWVKRQRYQYKLRADGKPSTMTIERINALERIGFVWDSHGAGWMERYNELKEYAAKYGSCNVSSSYISFHGSQLSSWVKCQRRQYKMYKEGAASNMTTDRITKLESIGFEWELRRPRTSNLASGASKSAKDTSKDDKPALKEAADKAVTSI